MTEVVVECVAPNRVVVSSPGPQDVTTASSDFADFQTRTHFGGLR